MIWHSVRWRRRGAERKRERGTMLAQLAGPAQSGIWTEGSIFEQEWCLKNFLAPINEGFTESECLVEDLLHMLSLPLACDGRPGISAEWGNSKVP